ncbi:MAG: hypothetical protein J0L88_11940 [Xanthomonadales bacterium]|nr:hypothetical protein [Xanthomonadales bacterium]
MIHIRTSARTPLARLVAAVLTVLAIAAVFALGVFALAALVVGAVVLWLYRAVRGPALATRAGAATPPPPPGIIDGEFTVVRASTDKPATPLRS